MSCISTSSAALEYALLGLVRQEPLPGAEVYQRLKTGAIPGMPRQVKQSEVYTLLVRLEQSGYLAATRGTQWACTPRKVWCLTEAGRAAFTAWMTTPVARWQDVPTGFVMRLWFAHLTSDAVALKLVEAQSAVSRTWLATLPQQVATYSDGQSMPWLAYALQQRRIRAFLDWLAASRRYFRDPVYLVHTLAPLRWSQHPTLAQRFVDYVCSLDGQALLESYRFLPVSPEAGTALPVAPTMCPTEVEFSPNETLTIYTAVPLLAAFQTLASTFSGMYGDLSIELVVAGSRYLADQVRDGAPADIFAAADPHQVRALCAAGYIQAGSERPFARQRLIAVTADAGAVRRTWRRGVTQAGINVALGAHATGGGYALGAHARYGDSMPMADQAALRHDMICDEQDVGMMLSRVLCGDVDIGVLYPADAGAGAAADLVTPIHPLDELWLSVG